MQGSCQSKAQRQDNTCLQSLSSTDRCSGVSLWLSFSAPTLVLGHFEPGFSRGNSECLLLSSCLRPASAGEKPLYCIQVDMWALDILPRSGTYARSNSSFGSQRERRANSCVLVSQCQDPLPRHEEGYWLQIATRVLACNPAEIAAVLARQHLSAACVSLVKIRSVASEDGATCSRYLYLFTHATSCTTSHMQLPKVGL